MDKATFDQMYKNHILYLTRESDGENPSEDNFSGLDFTGMSLDGLNLSNADFSNADFTNTSMRCCTFHDCNFNGARFKDVDASCSEFDHSTFRYSNIKSSTMSACSFDSCHFIRTFAENTDFAKSVFVNSNFEGCMFICANFIKSILADTFFDGFHTSFKYCNFNEANTKGLKGLKSIIVSQCFFNGDKPTNSLRRLNQKEFLRYVLDQMVYTIKSFFRPGKRLESRSQKMLPKMNKE